MVVYAYVQAVTYRKSKGSVIQIIGLTIRVWVECWRIVSYTGMLHATYSHAHIRLGSQVVTDLWHSMIMSSNSVSFKSLCHCVVIASISVNETISTWCIGFGCTVDVCGQLPWADTSTAKGLLITYFLISLYFSFWPRMTRDVVSYAASVLPVINIRSNLRVFKMRTGARSESLASGIKWTWFNSRAAKWTKQITWRV